MYRLVTWVLLALATAAAQAVDTPFATVGETVISAADFQRALAVAMR